MTNPAFPFDLDRRTLLTGAAAATAAATLGVGARAAGLPGGNLFTLGVASGDPTPDGMVLWTRLAPEPLQGDGGMPGYAVPVRWEIAADPGFHHMTASGTAMADPRWGHSVHVETSGLQPGRPYWYRFTANGQASPVGRTRTAPAADATVDRLRFCFGSCQKYEAGRYAAWAHVVEEDPDLILFLGDYIYEGAPKADVRIHLNPEPRDVPGYRVRYATYRLDPLLQAAHQIAPWAVIWDDHEVANDYADLDDEHNGDPARFRLRRAAAYQVYWEHMPLRRAARPDGAAMHLYRSLRWGRLAEFQLIDDRQYRSPRPCQPPELKREHRKYLSPTPDCPERDDPARSILGTAQERWLNNAFSASRATWNLLAQQTLMTPYPRYDPNRPDQPPVYTLDTWEAYPASRARILRHWRDHRISNPVVLSGDIHAFVAADMPDPDRPDAPPVASEFVGGSITSHSGDSQLKANAARDPGYRFAEGAIRGYGRGDLTAKGLQVVYRGLDDPARADSAIASIARFTLEEGKRGMTVQDKRA